MADDYSASIQTTGRVAVGGTAAGTIETRRDVDWFAVELVAGRTYIIDLKGADSGGGTLGDTVLRGLYDKDGNRIVDTQSHDGGAGDDARLTFTATETGTHYIAARGHRTETGTYTVRVTDETPAPAADPDATAAGAIDLGDLAALTGRQQHRDAVDGGADGTDYYRFVLTEAKTVKLSLRKQDADADLYLEDWDGAVLYSSAKSGAGNEGIEETLQAGIYHVRVVAREAGENAYALRYAVADPQQEAQQQSVQVSVSERSGRDFPDDVSTKGRVAVGGSVTGEFENMNDFDWFAVELEKGKTYRFDLEGKADRGGRMPDPQLYGIYDAKGNLIADTANDDYSTGNSRVFFKAPASGTYYVEAAIYVEWGTPNEGSYTLSVVEHPDDFSADAATTGAVAVNGSARGEITSTGDVDWFAVELQANQTYVVDLKGKQTGHGTLWDPYLRGIHDKDGNLIAGTAHDDIVPVGTVRDPEKNIVGYPKLNSRVLFTPDEDGTYYVAAGASHEHSQISGRQLGPQYSGHNSGTYTVRVAEFADTDATAAGAKDLGDIAALRGMRVHQGTVEGIADKVDYYRFTLSEAKTVKIDLGHQDDDVGTHVNADLYLEDGNGAVLYSSAEDGIGSEHIRTTLEAGTYYVRVAAREAGTNAYALRYGAVEPEAQQRSVSASVPEPGGEDFPTDGSTQGQIAVGDSVTGKVESGRDHDWFAVTLEAGKTYRFDLKGTSTGDGTLKRPELYGIHDAHGDLIADTRNWENGSDDNSRVFFEAPESGIYYVAAGADTSGGYRVSGTYTLSVAEHPDDFSADTDTTGAVAVNGSAKGEITITGDVDWYAVELQGNKAYKIELMGKPPGYGTLTFPHLRGIHDKDGNLIDGTAVDVDDVDWSGISRVFFRPSFDSLENFQPGLFDNLHYFLSGKTVPSGGETDTYYVAAGSLEGSLTQYSGWQYGTYTVRVTEFVDPHATVDDAFNLGDMTKLEGEWSITRDPDWTGVPNWIDCYSFTLTKEKHVAFQLENLGTDGDLYLNRADGEAISVGARVGTYDEEINEKLEPGTYHLYVVKVAPEADDDSYILRRWVTDKKFDPPPATPHPLASAEGSEPHGADFPDDVSTKGRVAVGAPVMGEIKNGRDIDWFAVELEKGMSYRFDLKGSMSGDGTMWDPILDGIYDAQGEYIAGTANNDNDDYTTYNSRVFFEAPKSGTYYVAATTYPLASEGDGGTYTLSVKEYPDDFSADTDTTGTVAVNGSAKGEITIAGDVDWFAVELQANKTYRFDLMGKQTGHGTLWDPSLRGIHDKDGNLVDATSNSRASFTPDKNGTYYVAAAGGEYDEYKGDYYGTYTLAAEEVVDAM